MWFGGTLLPVICCELRFFVWFVFQFHQPSFASFLSYWFCGGRDRKLILGIEWELFLEGSSVALLFTFKFLDPDPLLGIVFTLNSHFCNWEQGVWVDAPLQLRHHQDQQGNKSTRKVTEMEVAKRARKWREIVRFAESGFLSSTWKLLHSVRSNYSIPLPSVFTGQMNAKVVCSFSVIQKKNDDFFKGWGSQVDILVSNNTLWEMKGS
jgi:hypothetical protein